MCIRQAGVHFIEGVTLGEGREVWDNPRWLKWTPWCPSSMMTSGGKGGPITPKQHLDLSWRQKIFWSLMKYMKSTANLITVHYRYTHHCVQTNKIISFLPFLPRAVMRCRLSPADCYSTSECDISLAYAEGRKSSSFLFRVAGEWKFVYQQS